MNDSKIKNMYLLGYMILICVCIIVIIGAFTFLNFSHGYYRDWLVMIITLIGSMSGGILTMVGVILTLNRNEDDKLELDKRQIRKLSIIINNEFKEYIKVSTSCFNNHIKNLLLEYKYGESLYKYDELQDEIMSIDKPHEMIPNIKELIYELMLLSNNTDECKNVLEFYKLYLKHIEAFDKNSEENKRVLSEIYDKKYIDICNIGNNLIMSYTEITGDKVEEYIGINDKDGKKLKNILNKDLKLCDSASCAMKFLESNLKN